MLTEEDVASWNKLFSDCQINKSDLKVPSEQFLTNALVCYLRRFGYSIEPPFNLYVDKKENNRETRLFLIKLARQIDHFLKITDKTYLFTYYDLIKPTPKKTSHMLYILLNYYYYYNLYKEEVFNMAGEGIRKLKELKTLINETQRDNEHRMEENKNAKSIMERLMEELPVERSTLNELHKKRCQQEDEFQKLNNIHQDLKEKLKHLDDQKKALRKRTVPKEEFQELQNQLKQLKSKLQEQDQMELVHYNNLNQCKESNLRLQKLGKEVERAYEIIPLCVIKQVQESNKQLAKYQKEEHDLQLKANIIQQEIGEENLRNNSLEQEEKIKKQEFQRKRNEIMSTISTKRNILKERNATMLHLQEQDHLSECELEEQKDIAQYLLENLSEILPAHNV